MKTRLRKFNGFTIAELMVAIALMAVVLTAMGWVFKSSIDAQRISNATAEIMRTLRGITDQLNADFAGLRKDAPLAIRFEKYIVGTNEIRADRIMFCAAGDFKSVRPYKNNTLAGGVAKIVYAQGTNPPPSSESKKKVLTRKQTIFTADSNLPDPCSVKSEEYLQESFAQWRIGLPTSITDAVIDNWTQRPAFDPNALLPENVPLFMARGVDDFTIQAENSFEPNSPETIRWYPKNDEITGSSGTNAGQTHYPKALKFTFTLYDSKGIIKKGMRFSHIVYFEDK